MHDFIVVGAGPTGLYASIELAKRNNHVLVLEEDKRIGIPRHCTGVISYEAAKLIGNSAFNSAVNKVNSAIFKYGKKSFEISFPSETTLILDRIKFEELLFEESEKLGNEIMLGKRVKRIRLLKDKVIVDADKEYEAKALIYAAGSKPSLLDFLKAPASIPAIQYEIEGEVENDKSVEIIFSNEAKDFFVWKAPTSSNSFLLGLANSEISPKKALDKYIEKNAIKGKIRAIYSGKIIISGALERNVFQNIAIIGDSAGHVKPTTGGGLFFGILGAKIIGSLFPYYIESKNNNILKKIIHLNRKFINERINRMKRFSKIFFSLSEKQKEIILDSLFKSGAIKEISIDMQDFHENVISLFLKDLSLSYKGILSLIETYLEHA
jgi:flavin-dependent dehydrogenase